MYCKNRKFLGDEKMIKTENFDGLGKSPVVKKLRRNIKRISSCDVNVLIIGESGTGKELAARSIHAQSQRAGKPFVPVNCGAVPENLFENELFGHTKGAFTDACLPRRGVVSEAEGGTLFLDEIGVISPFIQVKLLRLLQEKEYKPLGDCKSYCADIRIIAATNQDPEKLMATGKFREDFFYRINIVSIEIPPLRERKEDIPILVEHFSKKYSHQYNRPIREITPGAMKVLVAYPWPGNIRELENKIQQTIVLATGDVITEDDLGLNKMESKSVQELIKPGNFKKAKEKIIRDFEKQYLSKLLKEFNGDVVAAADCAGKSRTAFWNLLKKREIHPRSFRSS